MIISQSEKGLIDVSTFVGSYPFRHVPHPDPQALVAVMKREGITRALTGYLPVAWHRSTSDANRELFRLLEPHAEFLSPVPAINPAWPGWRRELDEVASLNVAAVSVYPPQYGIPATSVVLNEMAVACAERNVSVLLTTRFEDSRQLHSMDSAREVDAATVRSFARAHANVRVVLTCAGRSLIEEIHWSLSPSERERVWYDISWIWGPPQHDLAHLFRTVGASRFLFGSMWPMRLVQTPFANLELLPDDVSSMELGFTAHAFPLI